MSLTRTQLIFIVIILILTAVLVVTLVFAFSAPSCTATTAGSTLAISAAAVVDTEKVYPKGPKAVIVPHHTMAGFGSIINVGLVAAHCLEQLGIYPIFIYNGETPYLETRPEFLEEAGIAPDCKNFFDYFFEQPFISKRDATELEKNLRRLPNLKPILSGSTRADPNTIYLCDQSCLYQLLSKQSQITRQQYNRQWNRCYQLNAKMQAELATFEAQIPADKELVAVHIRLTDKIDSHNAGDEGCMFPSHKFVS
jgi:hypothetical protein